jgi:hypothetical protein
MNWFDELNLMNWFDELIWWTEFDELIWWTEFDELIWWTEFDELIWWLQIEFTCETLLEPENEYLRPSWQIFKYITVISVLMQFPIKKTKMLENTEGQSKMDNSEKLVT